MTGAFQLLEKVRRHSLVPLKDFAQRRRVYSENLNIENQYNWDKRINLRLGNFEVTSIVDAFNSFRSEIFSFKT